MTKKKILSLILGFFVIIVLASCNTKNDNTASTKDEISHIHLWDDGKITKYPSINNEGEKTYKCSTCNEIKIEKIAKDTDNTSYTLKAKAIDGLTGVYEAKAKVGDNKNENATLGIPSVAKQNILNHPTYESPAIIQGAAVGYENKTGPTEYTRIEGKKLLAPYSYFRYEIVDEKRIDADGKESWHKKLSGFDGSYYIIRVDVTDIIKDKTGYLHMRQEDNKALLVVAGMQGGVDTLVPATDANNNATTPPELRDDGYWYNGDKNLDIKANPNSINQAFQGANGNWYVGGTGFVGLTGTKSAVYSIEDGGAALKDTNGNYMNTPYIDVIVISSSKIVAGADTGGTNAPKSDIALSFYVDDVLDYDPSLKYDPHSTDPNHPTLIANKFFKEENMTSSNRASSYLVKGSDLEIDVVTVEDTNKDNEYWSLNKAISFQDYNEHTIKLICEVPVLEALEVRSINGINRNIIFDLNSFDIQIANHTQTNAAALTVSDNAILTIKDSSRTSGAELAIGNNASMLVRNNGVLIIDSSCQLEVEYDAASTMKPKSATLDDVINKINALPEADSVTEENRVAIEEAKNYYDVLSEETKALVTNYQKLEDCLAKLKPAIELINGEIVIESGGKIINNGVINIEGLEVKPSQPSQTDPNMEVVRDLKSASLTISSGGILDNYGCLSVKGTLYVLGTLNNYGNYDDLIEATDPDKGIVNYHKGIQLTWKDDITVLKEGTTNEYTINKDILPGQIILGINKDDTSVAGSVINNYGSIVLVPGIIKGAGTFNNLNEANKQGKLYLCSVDEAIVPITPTQAEPTKIEERRQFNPAYSSVFNENNTIICSGSNIYTARVELVGNALFGNIIDVKEY